MRKRSRSTPWAALGLLLALLWCALGAPLTQSEREAVPSRVRRSWRQLPVQFARVFSLWHTPQTAAMAQEEELLLRVYDTEAGAIRLLPLESYVVGVVAAEMPASWPEEALQCQAVAARTRAVGSCRSYGGAGCQSHPDADLCTDSACCQGWLSPEGRKAKWGDSWQPLEERVEQAVQDTCAQVLTYEGEPIEVLYHASSGGQTEDAAEVFSQSVPYLRSVDSPGEESYEGYAVEQRFSLEEAAELLLAAFPDCGVEAAALPSQLELISLSETGRVKEMRVGNQTVQGREVRAALGLRSTLFTWETVGDTLIFRVRGYGHGVGMSQAGARAMAAAGSDCAEILAHYYPGTVLTSLP